MRPWTDRVSVNESHRGISDGADWIAFYVGLCCLSASHGESVRVESRVGDDVGQLGLRRIRESHWQRAGLGFFTFR